MIKNKILRKSQQRLKNDRHYLSTVKVNKVDLSNKMQQNDNKRIQRLDFKSVYLTSKNIR